MIKQIALIKRKHPVNQPVPQCFGLFQILIFFFYTHSLLLGAK